MSDLVIQAEGLSKVYRIGQRAPYGTLRELVTGAVVAPMRRIARISRRASSNGEPRSASAHEYMWALKDVSFDVRRGEVVGVIGRNGAGKSTLLKILSRITTPTKGYADLQGRVGSLLEVGSGFHPELTGRENIYLNGAILGMKRAEIESKFDEIVAFSEINRFIDTPVKHYSSGMYMRLAFAVAAHLEPEILVVDEVLAVGDAAFQKKCLGKMGNVAQEGRTILFVSHNMEAVQSLCSRVMLLHDGQIREIGSPSQVVSSYLQTSLAPLGERVWNDFATAPGNDKVRLHRACVRPTHGLPSDPITVRTPFVMEFAYWNQRPNAYLSLSLHLYNEQGILVFDAAPVREQVWQGGPFPVGLIRDTCYVPGDLLNDGRHRVALHIVQDQGPIIHKEDDILVFDILDAIENRGGWYGSWGGAIRPMLEWTTDVVEEPTLAERQVLEQG